MLTSPTLVIQILKYIECLKSHPPIIKREDVISEFRKILKETNSVPITD